MTASASKRRPDTGRPSVDASSATPDIASARSTDGSHRVTNPKRTSSTIAAANRPPRLSRPSNGAASASTNATFWPETTRRWVSPDGPEVVDVVDRLLAVVAEDEAGEQGPAVVGERRRARQERAAHAVRQTADRVAERPRADRRR